MEHLMELVAASFARHGIVCPPQRHGISAEVANATAAIPTPNTLPEHNFRPAPPTERQSLQGDPAP